MIRSILFPALPLAVAVAALPTGCTAPVADPAAAASSQEVALEPVTVTTARGVVRFEVEVARTPEQQARGLMFRTGLADDRGMIFPFDTVRPASFWMRNVPIPLDIIFIRKDGTIARIAEAVPFSEELVLSGEPVALVLEIRGGLAAELGIAEGDRVGWRDHGA